VAEREREQDTTDIKGLVGGGDARLYGNQPRQTTNCERVRMILLGGSRHLGEVGDRDNGKKITSDRTEEKGTKQSLSIVAQPGLSETRKVNDKMISGEGRHQAR